MDIRKNSLDHIVQQLTQVKSHVNARAGLRLNDLNIHAEEFFKSLLNMVYGYNLANLNIDDILKTAIDLGDPDIKIAFQITSDKSRKKINETLRKFCENGSHKEFQTLKVLIIGDAPSRKGDFKFENFVFAYDKDIIDINGLLRVIQGLDTQRLKGISDWLTREFECKQNYSISIPDAQDFERYFAKFFNPDNDARLLLLQAQPTLADCKEIFAEEYYRHVHSLYTIYYYQLLEETKLNDTFRDKDFFISKSSTYAELRDGVAFHLPGGMTDAFKMGAFRPGKISYYTISFIANGKEHGVSFKLWVYLNNRWVFFPKPWQITRGIYALKTNSRFRLLIKVLKFLGVKSIRSQDDVHGIFMTVFLLGEFTSESK
jgi:hypothetical protein